MSTIFIHLDDLKVLGIRGDKRLQGPKHTQNSPQDLEKTWPYRI